MTVTLYSITPPTTTTTTTTSRYFLRPTMLIAPSLTDDEVQEMAAQMDKDTIAARTLDDIDDWYSQSIEDDGFLERLEKSAEITRFP